LDIAITGTINTLLLSVPAAIVLLFLLAKVGGPEAIFSKVQATNPQFFNLARGETALNFGDVTALGLLAVAIADQALWQKCGRSNPTAWRERSSGLALGSIQFP